MLTIFFRNCLPASFNKLNFGGTLNKTLFRWPQVEKPRDNIVI